MPGILVENWDGSVSIVGTNKQPFVDPGKKQQSPIDQVLNRSWDSVYSTPPNNVNKAYSPGSIQVRGSVPTTSGIGLNTGISSTSGIQMKSAGNLLNGIAGLISDQIINSSPVQKGIADGTTWAADQIRKIIGKPPLTELEKALEREQDAYTKLNRTNYGGNGIGLPGAPQVNPLAPPPNPKPLQNPGSPKPGNNPNGYNPNNPATPNRPGTAPAPIPSPLPIDPNNPGGSGSNIPDALKPTTPIPPGYPTVPDGGFRYDFPNPIGTPTQFRVQAKFLRQDLRNVPNGFWTKRQRFGDPYPFELNSGIFFGIPLGIIIDKSEPRFLDFDNDPGVTDNRPIWDTVVVLKYKTSPTSPVAFALIGVDYTQSNMLSISATAQINYVSSGNPGDQLANPNQPTPTPPPALPPDYSPPQFLIDPQLQQQINNSLGGGGAGNMLTAPPNVQPVTPFLPFANPTAPTGTPNPQLQPNSNPTPQPNAQPIPRDNPNNAGQPKTELKPLNKDLINPNATPSGNVQFNPIQMLPINGIMQGLAGASQRTTYAPTTGFSGSPNPATGLKGNPEMNPTNATGQLSSGAQQNLTKQNSPVEVPNQVTAPVCNDPCIADLQRAKGGGNDLVEIEVPKFLMWDKFLGAKFVKEKVKVPANMVGFAAMMGERTSDIRSRFGLAELRQKLATIMNALTTITVLHNAAMLSSSLASTLGDAVSNALKTAAPLLGVDQATADAIDVNEILGKSFNDAMESILGKDVWAGTKSNWQKANKIIQTGSNIIWTVRSMTDSGLAVSQWIAENTGKIGNALKRFRVVGENAYAWMPENVNAQNAWSQKIQQAIEKGQTLDDAASSLNSTLSQVKSIQDEFKELKEQKENFDKAIKDATPNQRPDNDPTKNAANASNAASKSPTLQLTDRTKGES